MAGVLGQTVAAPESYAPEVLERIARIKAEGAPEFGIFGTLTNCPGVLAPTSPTQWVG